MAQRMGLTFTIAMIIVVFSIFYIFPMPDPKGPDCGVGEIKMFAQDKWWCVQVRKP